MKNILICLVILTSSCGGVNRAMMGTSEKDLIKQVSIEKNCSKDQIKVLDSHKTLGNATYSLMACGKKLCYSQVGSVLMECSQKDNILKKKRWW